MDDSITYSFGAMGGIFTLWERNLTVFEIRYAIGFGIYICGGICSVPVLSLHKICWIHGGTMSSFDLVAHVLLHLFLAGQ